MGRCPDYLNVDGFDVLAESIGVSLTDDGVSAIGEICELLALQVLKAVKTDTDGNAIGFDEITRSAEALGIALNLDRENLRITSATI